MLAEHHHLTGGEVQQPHTAVKRCTRGEVVGYPAHIEHCRVVQISLEHWDRGRICAAAQVV